MWACHSLMQTAQPVYSRPARGALCGISRSMVKRIPTRDIESRHTVNVHPREKIVLHPARPGATHTCLRTANYFNYVLIMEFAEPKGRGVPTSDPLVFSRHDKRP